jgi:hypothetical protein
LRTADQDLIIVELSTFGGILKWREMLAEDIRFASETLSASQPIAVTSTSRRPNCSPYDSARNPFPPPLSPPTTNPNSQPSNNQLAEPNNQIRQKQPKS